MARQVPKSVLVFCCVTYGAALLLALAKHQVTGYEALYTTVLMWCPAFGRVIAVSTVDRQWRTPLPLRRWGRPRSMVLAKPVLTVLLVYSFAYVVALSAGLASWAPRWGSSTRTAVNVALNLPLGLLAGAATALGEEWGWRGFLQPRLDGLGIGYSHLWVSMMWAAFHLPVMIFSGYLMSGSPVWDFARFWLMLFALSFLFAGYCREAGSVWPAVWFHAAHNVLSQNIFPSLFRGGDNRVWLFESGLIPVIIYLFVAAIYVMTANLRTSKSAATAAQPDA